MTTAYGYAAHGPKEDLVPFKFERRAVGPTDVLIEITHTGICHSDLHTARSDWGPASYPVVPGHEIVGKVKATGADVKKVKVGDLVGVGCMVDSCRTCESCNDDLENYCDEGPTFTYNSKERNSDAITLGGYSNLIVSDEHFVLKMPSNLDVKAIPPLLCAGITTYSPLKHWKVTKGQKVGIIGLGGLGHMGVKFAKAMGAHVVMITTSPSKGEDAKKLGADEVLISTDASQMEKHANSFHFLLNTIPNGHDMNPYLSLLKRDGVMVLVGALMEMTPPVYGSQLIMSRRSVAGSCIGGIAETQEMLDFCGKHNIVSDVEVIAIDQVNTAYERLLKNDVKYRFVIDMSTLKTGE